MRFAGSAANPVPYIDLPLIPTSVKPGGPAFTLTVNGAGFVSASVVNWNGSPRASTFVSSTELTATILPSDIATAQTASVTVVSPSPGGGASNVGFFQVTGPTPTVALSAETLGSGLLGAVVAADFNRDGILDLAGLNGAICIELGNGDGTFQPCTWYTAGKEPAALAAGDLNGDGILDLAVANAQDDTVSVLLGNGDGTFGSQKTYATGVTPISVAAGDFNADGTLDLVVANHNADTVSILLGNGDGTFQGHIDLPVGSGPSSGIVADFNNDGKLDVAIANQGSNTVSILLGNGDGTFQPPKDSSAGSGPVGLAAGDFNGDGKLDLAVADGAPGVNLVSVLLGNGDGTFAAPVPYSLPGCPFAVAVGDFDGDGTLDLAVADFSASVLRGRGDGTFKPALNFSSLLQSGSAAVGDFNRDGKLDLATGVTVFLQTPRAATLSPADLFFLKQPVGTTSSAEQAKLTNTGELPLSISGITASGNFAQTNACGPTLKVFQGCLINVTFSPTSPGTTAGTLTITDDATGSPQTVHLVGAGIEVSFSPTALDFGSISVGMTSSPQTVTVTNVSNQTVSGFSVSISGLNSKDFAQTNTCTSLGPGASCTISATFTPSAAGIRKAVININDSAGLQNVALSGTGT